MGVAIVWKYHLTKVVLNELQRSVGREESAPPARGHPHKASLLSRRSVVGVDN